MHLHFKSSLLDYLHLTPSSWSITTSTMKLCALLFILLDVDSIDGLEECQIRALLIYLTNMHRIQMATVFYKLDLDQSGAMELEEFFLLISLLLANKDKKEKEFMHAHSKTVFDLLDEDGSGTITVEEFQRLGFLFNLDNRAIRLIFDDFDVSGDDALDYPEFRMFTLACINNQKTVKKQRLEMLLQRRSDFLAKQRAPILKYINKIINQCVPGLIVYGPGETVPRVTLPMNMKFRRQTKPSIEMDFPFLTTPNNRQSTFAHVFEALRQKQQQQQQKQTSTTNSIRSQSHVRRHSSSRSSPPPRRFSSARRCSSFGDEHRSSFMTASVTKETQRFI